MSKGKKKQEVVVEDLQEDQLKELQTKSEKVVSEKLKDLGNKKKSKTVNVKFPMVTISGFRREANKVYTISKEEHKELIKAKVNFKVV